MTASIDFTTTPTPSPPPSPHPHPDHEPSGYEADAELMGTSEEEEDETMALSIVEDDDSPASRRTSLEHITAKRGRGSRRNRRGCCGHRESRVRPSKRCKSSSSSSAESFRSGNDTLAPSDPPMRVKRLRLTSESEDDGTMYLGRTSCRPHGQYPHRHRTTAGSQGDQSQAFQWKARASASFMLLRGGAVKGVAGNLNDQPQLLDDQTQDVSLHYLSQIVSSTAGTLSSTSPTRACVTPDDTLYTNSFAETDKVLSAVASSSSTFSTVPDPVQTSNLSSLHCNISTETCNIAEAVSFSPRARLLLEAQAPHHVVHHNGAYESFLVEQRKWMPSELLSSVEYPNLNVAVEDLFVRQAVTLHPVQVTSTTGQDQTTRIITHYLLELATPPAVSLPGSVPGSNGISKAPSTSSFLSSIPARAVG